jgi:hypothetical protein
MQYARYARAYNASNFAAFNALLAPDCSIVENYGARPWPLLSDIRLSQGHHRRSLEIQVAAVRVRGDRAAALVDEVYARSSRRGVGFRRHRRDIWVRTPGGWRLKSVQILGTSPVPVA